MRQISEFKGTREVIVLGSVNMLSCCVIEFVALALEHSPVKSDLRINIIGIVGELPLNDREAIHSPYLPSGEDAFNIVRGLSVVGH